MSDYTSAEHHPAFEEYCETIFELAEDGVKVIQARIAERLEVSRPAVSEMVKRMTDEGLVTLEGSHHQLDRGRHLLATPWSAATGWPSASSPTCSVCRGPRPTMRPASGSTSSVPVVEAAIADALDNPTTCPHGNPIPGSTYCRP